MDGWKDALRWMGVLILAGIVLRSCADSAPARTRGPPPGPPRPPSPRS